MAENVSRSRRFSGHYDVVGKGLDLLCLSGFGCSNWLFEGMARDLSDLARFVMPDNRGMGRTPAATKPYEIDDLADDALRLADELNMRRFCLMGISMGGFIAQSIALRAPDRVRALVLMCTLGPGPNFKPLPINDELQLRELYDLPREERAEILVAKTTHPELARRNPSIYAHILHQRSRHFSDLQQNLFQFRAVQRFLQKTLPLGNIACPALVMSGADDRYVHPENSSVLAAQIPGASAVFIEESDHLFFLEKPNEVHQRLRAFLEGLP